MIRNQTPAANNVAAFASMGGRTTIRIGNRQNAAPAALSYQTRMRKRGGANATGTTLLKHRRNYLLDAPPRSGDRGYNMNGV
jgi:hypothetical protein